MGPYVHNEHSGVVAVGHLFGAVRGRRQQHADITFVVKPDPVQPSQVAVLANVNTWLAYNGWGGQSKYSGLARRLPAANASRV